MVLLERSDPFHRLTQRTFCPTSMERLFAPSDDPVYPISETFIGFYTELFLLDRILLPGDSPA